MPTITLKDTGDGAVQVNALLTSEFPTSPSVGTRINANRYGGGIYQQSLVRWVMPSALTSAPVTITSVTQRLHLNDTTHTDDSYSIGAYRVLAPVNYAQVCWSYAFGTTAWNTAGCEGAGTDRAASASKSLVIPSDASGWQEWKDSGLIADVQAWCDDPSSNRGWLMRKNGGGVDDSSVRAFKPYNFGSFEPELVITYTEGGGGGGGGSNPLLIAHVRTQVFVNDLIVQY